MEKQIKSKEIFKTLKSIKIELVKKIITHSTLHLGIPEERRVPRHLIYSFCCLHGIEYGESVTISGIRKMRILEGADEPLVARESFRHMPIALSADEQLWVKSIPEEDRKVG